MTPPRLTGNDDRLTLAAVARLEARVDGLEEDLREHKEGCEMVKSKLRNDLVAAREADTSARYEAVVAQRDEARAEIGTRRSFWREIIIGVVMLLLGTVITYYLKG